MSYHRISNWPPVWTHGYSRFVKTVTGEVGKLRNQDVHSKLIEHFSKEALFTYLGNTRPNEDPLSGIAPLKEENFEKAITDLTLILDGRLKILLKNS
jgi:hypothetical protein